MNKTLSILLNILLALAGIRVIVYSANQMSLALLVKDYTHLAVYLILALVCVYLTGSAIARLIKMWKQRKS